MKEDIKLPKETNEEYKYRLFINDIVINGIGPALKEVERVSLDLNAKTDKLIDILKPELKNMDCINIPRKYIKIHNLLCECIRAYIKGINYIIEGKTKADVNALYKAGQYIKEGNAWMGVTKTRMWEIIENAG